MAITLWRGLPGYVGTVTTKENIFFYYWSLKFDSLLRYF